MIELDKSEKYYAYLINNKYVQCQTIEKSQAYPNCDFVVLDKFHSGDNYRLSKFDFLKNNIPYTLTFCNWEVHNIKMSYKSSSNSRYTMTITDPLNEMRDLYEIIEFNILNPAPKENIHILEHAKNILNQYSKFNNWNEVDLNKENEKLKLEIIRLEEMINKKQ